MQLIIVQRLLDKQANTEDPYKKIFNIGEFPTIAATPIIKIPVPKKKDDAIEMPKYFLKITFKKVYNAAQPKLIIILPRTAKIKDVTFVSNEILLNNPDAIVPIKYVKHIHAIAKAHVIVLLII